ncbi:MAG: DEAD/DEAH box helicase [Actinomycetia bacterium]|nr:DEAD/DEAH box helicase [Actinomycetes bacterium]
MSRRGSQAPDPIRTNQKTLRLRPWQRQALDAYHEARRPDFLAVATPGAGKTTFALTAARLTLPQLGGRLVVVAPTRHLKLQWASAAEQFGLHLDTEWAPQDGLPADLHGIVTTYQQVATAADELKRLVGGGMAILDEVHHAGAELAWGEGVATAFASADRRLALSGTPFRSDTAAIPFLRYVGEQVVPDVEYGYGEALRDGGVVRPVYFPRFGGHMEWTAPDGSEVAATFDDALPRSLANQRLRAALSLEGEWLPAVLGHAHRQLGEIRQRHPEAAGLVIATDQDHAQAISRLLRDRFRVLATVAVSEDPAASDKIARFSASTDPWIIAVRMVSEGVDIPRLRVGVHATTTTTELFFRQAVGRIVRYTGGRARAYMFVPDDPRLRYFADSIAESRRHRLRHHAEDDDQIDGERADRADNDEQLSLFAVHSATVTDEPPELDDIFADHEEPDLPEPPSLESTRPELLIDLTSLPPVGSPEAARRGAGTRQERERQRSINTRFVRDLAALTGMTHAQINGELNRLSGVTKVSAATVTQLEKRAKAAADWYDRERRRLAVR